MTAYQQALAELRWERWDALTDMAEDFWEDYTATPAWGS